MSQPAAGWTQTQLSQTERLMASLWQCLGKGKNRHTATVRSERKRGWKSSADMRSRAGGGEAGRRRGSRWLRESPVSHRDDHGHHPAADGADSGADMQLHPMEHPTPQQVGMPWGKLQPVESPCWSSFLARPEARVGAHTGAVHSWWTEPYGKDTHWSSSWRTVAHCRDPTQSTRTGWRRRSGRHKLLWKDHNPHSPLPALLWGKEVEELKMKQLSLGRSMIIFLFLTILFNYQFLAINKLN